MTSLGGAPSPCTLGYWWGLEGTELTAFALGCWLCWALGTVPPGHRGTPPPAPPADELGLQAGDSSSGLQSIIYPVHSQLRGSSGHSLVRIPTEGLPSATPSPGPGSSPSHLGGESGQAGGGRHGPLPQDQVRHWLRTVV